VCVCVCERTYSLYAAVRHVGVDMLFLGSFRPSVHFLTSSFSLQCPSLVPPLFLVDRLGQVSFIHSTILDPLDELYTLFLLQEL